MAARAKRFAYPRPPVLLMVSRDCTPPPPFSSTMSAPQRSVQMGADAEFTSGRRAPRHARAHRRGRHRHQALRAEAPRWCAALRCLLRVFSRVSCKLLHTCHVISHERPRAHRRCCCWQLLATLTDFARCVCYHVHFGRWPTARAVLLLQDERPLPLRGAARHLARRRLAADAVQPEGVRQSRRKLQRHRLRPPAARTTHACTSASAASTARYIKQCSGFQQQWCRGYGSRICTAAYVSVGRVAGCSKATGDGPLLDAPFAQTQRVSVCAPSPRAR